MKNLLFKLLIILTSILIVINIILAISFHNDDIKFIKYLPYVVLTESMDPIVKKGDLAIVKNTDINSLKVNDVIAYKYDGVRTIGRIVSIGNDDAIVKADLQDINYEISKKEIKGIYSFKISKLGYIVLFFQSIYGLVILLLLVAILVVIYFLIHKNDEQYKENSDNGV